MKLYKLAVALLCLAGTATAKAGDVIPKSYYVNDGAKRTVYTLSQENLIQNGSFDDGVNGWKTVEYTTDAVADNFTLETEGGFDGGAYIITNGAGVGSENTIRQSVAVEVGKTYYFAVYTSGKAPDPQNFQYNALFKMTDEKTENGVLKQFEWPQGANNTATEWSLTEYIFTVEKGTTHVGVRMGWNKDSKFDGFVLAEVTKEVVEGNVDYATAAIPTANIGNGAFQYTSQQLQDAIATANALKQGEATVKEVEDAYSALKDAYSALKNLPLNKPAEGQLFNVVNVSANYDHAGKTLTFKAASNANLEENTTAMGWTEFPGSIYPQAVKFTEVEGELNTYTLSYTRADGKVVYASTGITSGLGGDTKQIRPTTDESKALKVYVEASQTKDGVWYLWNTECNKRLGGNGKGDSGFFTGEANNNNYYDIKLQEAVKNEVALNIDAENQYGTLIVPFDAELPEGVEAYSVETANGNVLNLNTEGSIKANTPYIVYAEEGSTAELAGLGAAYTDTDHTAGLLTGVYAETTVPEGSYVLQNQDETGIGFYKVESKDIKVKANHAYLTAAKGSDVKGFFFGSDDATAVKGVEAAGEKAGVIYNLAGQRVEKAVKGIYIINGKKMLVK